MAANPFDQFDRQAVNPFDQFDLAAKPEPKEGVVSSFMRGIQSYVPQLQESLGGLKTLAGAGISQALGPGEYSKGLIESGVKQMKAAEEKLQAATRPGESDFLTALDKGIGTVLTEYLPYQAGAGVSMIGESLAAVGAGALLGTAVPGLGNVAGAATGLLEKELVKKGVKEAAKKIALAQGEEAAKTFLEKETAIAAKQVAIKVGKDVGMVAQAGVQGFGQVANRTVGEMIERGEPVNEMDLGRVLGSGAVSTVAEFIGDKIGLGALKGANKEVRKEVEQAAQSALGKAFGTALNLTGKAGKGILVTGSKEAPVEVVQQLAERFGAKLDLTDQKAIDEYINSVAGAYAMSIVPGAVHGIRKPAEVAKPAEEQPKPLGLEYKPDPWVVFPDGSVGKRQDVENYINSLPEDQRIEARARLLGMGEKPATPIKEGAPLTEDEIFQLDQQLMAGAPRPSAEDILQQVRGQIQTAPPTTTADLARIRDEHETSVINSLLEQDKKMQSVSDLARLNLERMSQAESMEAATQDSDRRVREGRLMGRVQSLIDQNIPFASTAIADINRKFEMIGEAPLDDTERSRVQNIMTMAQGFTDFVKLPSLPVREQDIFAENQAMEALIKERKPRGQVSPQPVRTETPAPSPVVGQAPVSGRVEEGATIRPTISPKPGIEEDRQRAEPVAPPAAKPVTPPIQSEQQAKQQHAVQGLGIVEIPVNEVQLSEDVPQFKSDADQAGVVERLEGKFERTGVAPIQVWRRRNGRLEVISGRHRLDLAQRTGEATIPAQIHDEASGFDTTKAATLDAELNIRDGQGKVKDYVVYFEKSGITEDEAKSRGLLGRALGKRAWAIASKGSEELIAAHRGNVIDDAAAEAIASAAPGDSRLQAVGIKAIQDGKNTANAVNMIQAVRAMTQDRVTDTTFDMFGFDDSAIKEAENMAKAATQKQAEIDNRLRAISGAAKRPDIAKKEGVDVRDPNALKTRIEELKKERAAWDNWATNPDLVAEVRQSLQPTSEEGEGKKSLRAGKAQQLSDFEQTLRTALNRFGLKDIGLKLINGMTAEGSYAQKLIQIAADSANPIRTLRHEAIHALRELGFFTPQQWQSLSKMAKDKWIDQYLKQRNVDGKPLKAGEESRYDAYMREYNGDMEKITEEAVADAFADFDATKPPSGLMQALLTRLRNLFQAIKSALTKMESPEQIFGKVERGELVEKEVSRPAEEARKSLRKEEPKPTPTTAGQAALNTINQLGMGVKAPEEGRIDKVKEKLEQLGEAPVKDTVKEWRKAASDMFAKIDGSLFSADAPFENKLRQGLRVDFKNIEDFVGALLKISQSQAVAADAVSTRGMLIGKVEYREDLFKWVAVEDEANEINKARILDGIAKKYGLTKEEAVQVAHTYLSAANYEGILKRNAANKERIKELRAEGNTDEANRLSAAIVYVSPTQAAMVEPGLAIADQIPEVKEITTLWNKQRENVKNTMVETGLWTPEYADAMMDNAAYVPFYREMEEEADANPEMMIRGLQVKAKEHKLKGSEAAVADVFENMARWQQYAINRAIRNHKALQMIDAAQEMNMGDTTMARKVGEAERGKNVVRVWRDGKQEFYEMADPLFMDAFKSLGAVSIPTIKYFTKIANMLRESIVLYPMFSLGQVPQDAVAAIFASGLQPKFAFKIPYLAVKEFIKTMRGTSNIHNELRDFGAVGVRDFNASIAREDAEITAGIKAPRGVMGKTKYVLERIAMSADNAVRQAVYEASMQQPGITKAEALEKAFEIINFRRRGSSKMVNLIGQTVPFFYAYLSAQRVAYKTITGVGISPTERKAALETLAYTTAATMALSFIYAMANGDDEDYERTPSNVRDRSIVIPGTGGLRIPLRPDFFLFPKIIAEHTYHLMADNGFSDPAKFKKAMYDGFVNAALSPNVVPQIAKPTLEIAINYDFFQGKPIIGFFEQNKEASRQFNETTSELGKYLGRFGLSPQMFDHFARGYFGTVGGLVLWGTNFFIEGEPGVPRPEITASDMVATMPGMGAFKQKSTENALKVDFYELRDAIEKAKNTYDDMKTRSPEGLQTFLEDEKNLAKLAMEKGVTKIADHLSKIRRAIQQTAAAPEDRMSASEKEERIKELREVERQMLKGINLKSLREQAKL